MGESACRRNAFLSVLICVHLWFQLLFLSLLIVVDAQRAHLVELAFLAIAGRGIKVPQAAGG
jgi:hypothetical protein